MTSREKAIRVIQYGLGPIGVAIAKLAAQKNGIELVGGVDIASHIAGKDLGRVIGLRKSLGVKVRPTLQEAMKDEEADLVLHATGSFLSDVQGQLTEAIDAGVHVISTTEELAFPWIQNPSLARKINSRARKGGVTVLGIGINPGYILDAMVLALTGVCSDVNSIQATRVVDASKRRHPLQKKIGAGISTAEFRRRAGGGGFGHIGLKESLDMISQGLGIHLSSVSESLEPMIAREIVETEYLKVRPGQVTGINQTIKGKISNRGEIKLTLQMFVGAKRPYDEVLVDGTPPVRMRLVGGIHGDVATAAIVVNSIPQVMKAEPGLRTSNNLPLPAAILRG